MTTFLSNGLLELPSDHSGADVANNSMFLSNGLLGEVSKTLPSPRASDQTRTLPPTNGQSEKMLFVLNGMLSDTPANQSSPPEPSLPGLQDEDLPTVSQVLGVLLDEASSSTPTSGARDVPMFSVHARTFNGESIYLKRKCQFKGLAMGDVRSSQRIGNLLETPIHRLMEQLTMETVIRTSNLPSTNARGSSSGDSLWVDRYRPRRFIELTGNERVARDTMYWVKLWDCCVFGKNKGKKRQRIDEDDVVDDDQYRRPREKFLLLSGPPGLGKTTLAHVVAKHAGYQIMEINASDARSGQVVEDRIRPVLESGFAVGSVKPVLLIIDEIDGATGAGEYSSTFVHKLVQLTQNRASQKGRKQKERHNGARPLLRPIICICNDPNAASLAKLRPHARQIRITRPADNHVVRRLREICDLEGLKADMRALSTLVGLARGDLRGCINTLQFIKSHNEEVTENVIRRATSGMKEADTTIGSVLNNLFNPMSKRRVKELGISEDEENRYVERLGREVEATGKESSIALGCFGHYPNLRQHDATFSRYEKANDWLSTFDILSTSMYADGDFSLNPYLPYLLVPFYPLFQERAAARIERNQVDWENQQRTKTNEEIYLSLARCLLTASNRSGGGYRHWISSPILELEFAPFINRIISPPLRPVNSQVIRPEERVMLNRLVDIMSSLELRFVQERADDGQLTYRLDPPIDVFVNYDGKRAADIAVTRYAVRHLVAGEIEAKLVMHQADAVDKRASGQQAVQALEQSDDASKPPAKRAKTSLDIVDEPPTDFFGRLITTQVTKGTATTVQKRYSGFHMSYRFIEGNSAAVRKPVKIDNLL